MTRATHLFVLLLSTLLRDWRQGDDRAHFFAVAAQTMRRMLIDHGRARVAGKRAASSFGSVCRPSRDGTRCRKAKTCWRSTSALQFAETGLKSGARLVDQPSARSIPDDPGIPAPRRARPLLN